MRVSKVLERRYSPAPSRLANVRGQWHLAHATGATRNSFEGTPQHTLEIPCLSLEHMAEFHAFELLLMGMLPCFELLWFMPSCLLCSSQVGAELNFFVSSCILTRTRINTMSWVCTVAQYLNVLSLKNRYTWLVHEAARSK